MPFFQRYDASDGLCMALWKIEEDEAQLIEPLAQGKQLLNEAYKQFTSATRRLEWLTARRLVYELLGHSDFTIDYLSSGKPFLRDDSFKISISHTRGYAAVILHPTINVGIDIEQVSSKVKRVRSRYISEIEEKIIPLDDEEKQLIMLLLFWSAKETLFKLIDKDNVDFIQHLHISPFELADAGSFDAWESRTSECITYKIHYQVYTDFVLTWGYHSVPSSSRGSLSLK